MTSSLLVFLAGAAAVHAHASFVPLPPPPPLPPAPPLHSRALERGAVLQLYGHTQFVGLTDPKAPAALAATYHFDAVIVMPYASHNAICTAPSYLTQSCSPADVLSAAQFTAGIKRWVALNISIILYTSIMHCGHAPVWQSGELQREHPEFSQADEKGQCPSAYGNCNLSPASLAGVRYTLNYTLGLLEEPWAASAVMIDNAQWQQSAAHLPTGFEPAAVAGFRRYLAERFGDEAKAFVGVAADEAEPPPAARRNESAPSALFGAWKLYRARAYAAAAEAYRVALHAKGVSVLANSIFWPLDWQDDDGELVQHVDAVIAESRIPNPAEMSVKEELGRALSVGRPQLNYLGVFSDDCKSKYAVGQLCALRELAVSRGMAHASMLQLARPWLVAWGLSPRIDGATGEGQAAVRAELSSLMAFRAKTYDELFDFGGSGAELKAVRVGVLTSWREADTPQAPAHVLRHEGVPYRFETEVTILRHLSLDPSAPFPLDVLLCEANAAALSSDAAEKIVRWVRDGGTLVAAAGRCAVRDEAGRAYARPLLEAALDASGGGAGRGRALFVPAPLASSAAAMGVMRGAAAVPSAGGACWELSAWGKPTEPSRLVVHFSNTTNASASCSDARPRPLSISLPLSPAMLALIRGGGALHAMLHSPYEGAGRTLDAALRGGRLELAVEAAPRYGVAVVTVGKPEGQRAAEGAETPPGGKTAAALVAAPLPAWRRSSSKGAFHPRDSASSWVHAGKLWLGGGWFDSFSLPPRDVWSYSDGEWEAATQQAPWSHADFAATATLGGRMLHIGGWFGGRLPNASASAAVWASEDGKTWTQLVHAAPWEAREGAAALVLGGRVWLLGGATQYYFAKRAPGGRQLLNDVWSSEDGEVWACATKAAGWSPRAYHAAVAFGGRMFVMGGGNWQTEGEAGRPVGYEARNDVWASADGSAWEEVGAAGWSPRIWFGAAVYRERFWVLGGWPMPNGWNQTANLTNWNANDVWSSADGASWTEHEPAAWDGRHASCVQVFDDALWVVAGNDWNDDPRYHGTVNEAWSLRLPTSA